MSTIESHTRQLHRVLDYLRATEEFVAQKLPITNLLQNPELALKYASSLPSPSAQLAWARTNAVMTKWLSHKDPKHFVTTAADMRSAQERKKNQDQQRRDEAKLDDELEIAARAAESRIVAKMVAAKEAIADGADENPDEQPVCEVDPAEIDRMRLIVLRGFAADLPLLLVSTPTRKPHTDTDTQTHTLTNSHTEQDVALPQAVAKRLRTDGDPATDNHCDAGATAKVKIICLRVHALSFN